MTIYKKYDFLPSKLRQFLTQAEIYIQQNKVLWYWIPIIKIIHVVSLFEYLLAAEFAEAKNPIFFAVKKKKK